MNCLAGSRRRSPLRESDMNALSAIDGEGPFAESALEIGVRFAVVLERRGAECAVAVIRENMEAAGIGGFGEMLFRPVDCDDAPCLCEQWRLCRWCGQRDDFPAREEFARPEVV